MASPALHLSALLRRPVLDQRRDVVGRVIDVVARLRAEARPVVIGCVLGVGGREVFLPISQIVVHEGRLDLSRDQVDLRRFERREGEILLHRDLLGHRVIEVASARLLRADDVELALTTEGWVVHCVDVHQQPFRMRWRRSLTHDCRAWETLEPLVGHARSARIRRLTGSLRRLRPAQLADLLESASHDEGEEILGSVHEDPELEADVFEELDPDLQARLFTARSDGEIAKVLGRMRADDAADAIAQLPQVRRIPVLELLPGVQQTKVRTLLGFSSTTAGGLMGVEFVQAGVGARVSQALQAIREAGTIQPEALYSVLVTDGDGHLLGVASLVRLLQADPDAMLLDVAEADPVVVDVTADASDVALRMTDYNLLLIPVVDASRHLVGVITVDDVLEVALPPDWRRRERAQRIDDEATGGKGDDS